MSTFPEYSVLKAALGSVSQEGHELCSSAEESLHALRSYLGSLKWKRSGPSKTIVAEYERYCQKLRERNASLLTGIEGIRSFPEIQQKLRSERVATLKLQEVAEQSKAASPEKTAAVDRRIEAANASRDRFVLLDAETRSRMVAGLRRLLNSLCDGVLSSASQGLAAIERAELAAAELEPDEEDSKIDSLRQSLAELERGNVT